MDKLILVKPKPVERNGSTAIRIDGRASKLLDDFAEASGLSKYRICSEMIKFASKHLEIQDEEEPKEQKGEEQNGDSSHGDR
ncbi:MAG: hypothetical protein MR704_14660 [Clostridia bacterium]|nr:hypothetical protein [Clostridia bacterium]